MAGINWKNAYAKKYRTKNKLQLCHKTQQKTTEKIGNIKYMSKCGKIDLYFKASYHIV